MRGEFYQQLTNDLETARAEGLFKEERIITSAQQADITVADGSHVINFCANNYLGLANHPDLIAAAKAAHCHEFIERLPNGYQTHLAEGGNTLSGGEKQRIAIARAILKDAPILLLDESTASLDADNEAKINQALDRLMKGKTVFVIAHRLNTIQNADQIIVLNQGRIEETGTNEELLRKKGHYYEMVQEQQKAREWIVKGA